MTDFLTIPTTKQEHHEGNNDLTNYCIFPYLLVVLDYKFA